MLGLPAVAIQSSISTTDTLARRTVVDAMLKSSERDRELQLFCER